MSSDVPLESFLKMAGTIIAVIAWLAAAVKKRGGRGGAPPAPAGEQDERARRVREEVQRKIAARQRQDARGRLAQYGAEPPPAPAAPPPPQPKPVAAPAPAFPPDLYEWSGSARREDEALTAPVRSEETRLAEEVRAMQAVQAAPEAAFTAYTPPAVGAAPESPWLTELRQPGGARRAIVLREILGPPLALR